MHVSSTKTKSSSKDQLNFHRNLGKRSCNETKRNETKRNETPKLDQFPHSNTSERETETKQNETKLCSDAMATNFHQVTKKVS